MSSNTIFVVTLSPFNVVVEDVMLFCSADSSGDVVAVSVAKERLLHKSNQAWPALVHSQYCCCCCGGGGCDSEF